MQYINVKRFKTFKENLVNKPNYSYNIIKGDENIFELFLDGNIIGKSKFSDIEKSGYFGEKYIEIYDFEILDGFRNRGYSKILLTKLLKYLSSIVKLVELHVKEDNKIAIRLYETMGFETYFYNYGYLSMFKRI
jgi:ribosomal protein S18 acetylase RimI-like enzyme